MIGDDGDKAVAAINTCTSSVVLKTSAQKTPQISRSVALTTAPLVCQSLRDRKRPNFQLSGSAANSSASTSH